MMVKFLHFLERLFGIFNISSYSWIKSAIHLFFSSPVALVASQSRNFQFFKKTLTVFAFFGPFHFSWDFCFFKSTPYPLLLTVYRDWDNCWTLIMTFQLPPKNWQSSITSLKNVLFLADTVDKRHRLQQGMTVVGYSANFESPQQPTAYLHCCYLGNIWFKKWLFLNLVHPIGCSLLATLEAGAFNWRWLSFWQQLWLAMVVSNTGSWYTQ